MISETEQWKLTGDCNKCRRAGFCRKSCTPNKEASQRYMQRVKEAIIGACLPEPFAGEAKKWTNL